MLVLVSGRPDHDYPVDKVLATTRDTLDQIHRDFPKSAVVVIAPYLINNAPRVDVQDQFVNLERDVADEYGWTFIDPLAEGWINEHSAQMVASDGVHPNAKGHQYLADHLAGYLRSSGLADQIAAKKRAELEADIKSDLREMTQPSAS